MPTLSRNAQCIVKILQAKDSLTTSEILELVKRAEYAELCRDCAGGDTFVIAANQLVEQGIISRRIGKGGYRWQMVRR